MMVSPEDDRHNGWVFTLCYVLIYISAPVLYVGVVQAALCDKLGAGATLANLPASTYMFGQMAPLVFSWLVPHRLERSVVVWSNLATGLMILGVALSLALAAARFRLMPLADEPRQPFFPFLASAFRGFAGNRPLLLMWFAYLLWYTSLGITSNLSLFTREAMGRDPKDYSGFILAIRFGC